MRSHPKLRTDLSLWKSIYKCFFLVSSLSPKMQITIEKNFLKHCSPLFLSLVSCQKTTKTLKFFSKTTREAPHLAKSCPYFLNFASLFPSVPFSRILLNDNQRALDQYAWWEWGFEIHVCRPNGPFDFGQILTDIINL